MIRSDQQVSRTRLVRLIISILTSCADILRIPPGTILSLLPLHSRSRRLDVLIRAISQPFGLSVCLVRLSSTLISLLHSKASKSNAIALLRSVHGRASSERYSEHTASLFVVARPSAPPNHSSPPSRMDRTALLHPSSPPFVQLASSPPLPLLS